MSNQTFTVTATTTFNVTHARHMAAKVAADLKRMQRYYGEPSDADIAKYETEVIELLQFGYLGEVTYGYKRGDKHIDPTLRYTAKVLAADTGPDDGPGRVSATANTAGATFYSYLTYSSAWLALTDEQRARFKAGLPFQRTNADAPGVDGEYVDDRTYSAGGRALGRASVRKSG